MLAAIIRKIIVSISMKSENQNTGLGQFIAIEYKNLVKYVRKYLNEKYYNVTAEDIVQDVALNLFTKLDFDAKIENVAGYVYRSVKNRVVDVQRKPKNEVLLDQFNDEEDSNGDDFIAKLLAKAQESETKLVDNELFHKKLQKAFEELPAKQRAVIIATEFEGYSFEELSDEWDVPIGTLLSWKHRGIKKLKEYIKLDDFYIVNEENN